jgi:hypothetical protein
MQHVSISDPIQPCQIFLTPPRDLGVHKKLPVWPRTSAMQPRVRQAQGMPGGVSARVVVHNRTLCGWRGLESRRPARPAPAAAAGPAAPALPPLAMWFLGRVAVGCRRAAVLTAAGYAAHSTAPPADARQKTGLRWQITAANGHIGESAASTILLMAMALMAAFNNDAERLHPCPAPLPAVNCWSGMGTLICNAVDTSERKAMRPSCASVGESCVPRTITCHHELGRVSQCSVQSKMCLCVFATWLELPNKARTVHGV